MALLEDLKILHCDAQPSKSRIAPTVDLSREFFSLFSDLPQQDPDAFTNCYGDLVSRAANSTAIGWRLSMRLKNEEIVAIRTPHLSQIAEELVKATCVDPDGTSDMEDDSDDADEDDSDDDDSESDTDSDGDSWMDEDDNDEDSAESDRSVTGEKSENSPHLDCGSSKED
jgi:hypothetical protein